MGQTEYKQQNSFRNRLNIIDTLVGQAAKTEIESISAAYLIQANQEINLLELKYGSELTIQQNLYKVKVAFLQMNRLILNNLAVSYFRDYARVEKEFVRFHRLICAVKND
ncbi:MAG: hypothetical protein DUD28_07815 [Lactobacillus sp.]|nr:MAG: hypothetical protein DUD28_07815 [Lactobacillus sp.]